MRGNKLDRSVKKIFGEVITRRKGSRRRDVTVVANLESIDPFQRLEIRKSGRSLDREANRRMVR